MQGGFGRKYRVKPRFYIILVAALGIALWAVFALLNAFSQPRVEWERLSSDQSISAIVLRDEQIIVSDSYARLDCLAAEGETVAKDAPVAMLYLTGFSEKDITKLANLQNEIKDYQENNVLKDIVNKDLQALNSKIDDKMSEISAMAIGRHTQDMALRESELRAYMDERKAFMLNFIPPDEALDRLYQSEATLQAKIDQTRKSVNAVADGLVSYYLDGYESILSVNGIGDMTPAKMKALRDKMLSSSQPFSSEKLVSVGQAICRIVNPDKWYAIIVTAKSENSIVEGLDYEITFDGLQQTVTATAMKVLTEGRTTLVVLAIPEGAKEMISLRLVNGHLGKDVEGLRIPLNMLLEENGKVYIAVQGSGGAVTRIEVAILGRDDKHAIVSEVSGEGALINGLPLVKP